MTTLKVLTTAAEAVRDARTELERIDGQAAGLRKKLEEIDGLKARLAEAEDRRAELLEEALLAGREADTGQADKLITAAQRAIERRKDERIAIERALPNVQAQREAAQSALAEHKAQFDRCRAEHLAACTRKAIIAARDLAAQFSSAIADARACLGLIPERTPERSTLGQEVEKLRWEIVKTERDPGPWGSVWVNWAAPALAGPVTSQARLDLDGVLELTGAPEESTPTAIVAEDEPLEYVWSDGTIHTEPEPPSEPPVRVITAQRGYAPGRIELHPEKGYTPGLVRSY